MNEHPADAELIARARSGERLAFERLLVRVQRPLAQRIRQRIPARLKHLIDVDDILQECFVDGWEGIAAFRPAGESSLFAWLARIADNRILDQLKAFRAAKRGGDWRRIAPGPDEELTQLLAMLAVNPRTPSRSAADREALQMAQAALPTLKRDYHDVLRLRFVEGVSIRDTAERMNRSEWAVHKLTARALESLREAMGGVSRFLSRK